MTVTRPGVDVVVTNYRTAGDLDEFLRSFDEHTPQIPWTLYVVNVEPTERDLLVGEAWAKKLGPEAHHLTFDTNIGYARACNRAAKFGDRQVVALFNADIVLTPGAIDACCGALLANGRWGVLGPRQVNQHGRITHAGMFGTLDAPTNRGWLQHAQGDYVDIRDDAVTVSGSAYFVRRRVWQEMADCLIYRAADPQSEGAMLQTQLYFEETWVSYHAQAHGYKVAYFGPVTIVHKWHEAIKQNGVEAWAGRVFKESQETFRAACDLHSIDHD